MIIVPPIMSGRCIVCLSMSCSLLSALHRRCLTGSLAWRLLLPSKRLKKHRKTPQIKRQEYRTASSRLPENPGDLFVTFENQGRRSVWGVQVALKAHLHNDLHGEFLPKSLINKASGDSSPPPQCPKNKGLASSS
jgi:hypothetical protein